MAYITIPALPAGVALTGLEQFEAVQSSVSVKLTANQIKTFTSSSPSLSVADTATNTISNAANLAHTTSLTPAVGFGTGLAFTAQVNLAGNFLGAQIGAEVTNVGLAAETFDLVFKLMNLGVPVAEVARLTANNRLGVGTSTPATTIQAVLNDGSTTVSRPLQITHTTSVTPLSGIGTGMAFETETAANTNRIGAAIDAVTTSVSSGAENFDLVFSMMQSGAAVSEFVRFKSTGRVGINTSTPSTSLESVFNDISNNTVLPAARFTRTTSGTPANGIGTAVEFSTETAVNTNKVGGAIYTQSISNVGSGAENFSMAFAVMRNGVAGVEVMRVTNDLRVGINTTTPAVPLQTNINDTVTNTSSVAGRFSHLTSSTPTNGIGTAIDFEVQTGVSASRVGSVISTEASSVSNGAENFDLIFKTMTAGAAATEKFKIGSSVITPSIPFSQFGAGVAPSVLTNIKAATNSLTVSPFQFDTAAPTLLTNAQNGAFEFNGQSLYFTPQNSERGVVATRQTYVNTAGTRAGPNAVNTAQAVTVNAGSPTLTVTTVPGTAIGNTGAIAIFSAAVMPTGLVAGQPYFVNFLSATTMTVSATQGGVAISPTTNGNTVTVVFLFPILGIGLTSVGLNLAASTRYQYDLFFNVSHTGVAATSISYGLVNLTGTLSAHGYRVTSQGSTAAISGNLTGVANTSSSYVSNYITSGFATTVLVTGVTAATANTTNLVQIQGQIDTLSACTFVVPVINMAVNPTASTILQGAYMSIYPLGPVVSNTSIGNWVI